MNNYVSSIMTAPVQAVSKYETHINKKDPISENKQS